VVLPPCLQGPPLHVHLLLSDAEELGGARRLPAAQQEEPIGGHHAAVVLPRLVQLHGLLPAHNRVVLTKGEVEIEAGEVVAGEEGARHHVEGVPAPSVGGQGREGAPGGGGVRRPPLHRQAVGPSHHQQTWGNMRHCWRGWRSWCGCCSCCWCFSCCFN